MASGVVVYGRVIMCMFGLMLWGKRSKMVMKLTNKDKVRAQNLISSPVREEIRYFLNIGA